MPESSKPVPDVAHFDDGGVRYRGFLLDGEMHGAWEFFRKDGSPMRSGDFDRGRQIGTWRTYDRAGKFVKETDFLEGRLIRQSSLPASLWPVSRRRARWAMP